MKALNQYQKFEMAYEFFNRALFHNQLPEAFITLQSKGGSYGYYSEGRFRRGTGGDEKLDEIALNPDYFFYGELEVLQTLAHEMVHLWQHHYGTKSRSGYHNQEWANKMEAIGLMPSDTGKPGGKKTGQKVADYAIEGGPFMEAVTALNEAEGAIVDWGYFSWESHRLEQIHLIRENMMYMESVEGVRQGSYITVGPSTVMVDDVDENENSVNFHTVAGPELPPNEINEILDGFIKTPQIVRDRGKNKYSCPSCGLSIWGKAGIRVLCMECDVQLQKSN